jgi:hypothetical protein
MPPKPWPVKLEKLSSSLFSFYRPPFLRFKNFSEYLLSGWVTKLPPVIGNVNMLWFAEQGLCFKQPQKIF